MSKGTARVRPGNSTSEWTPSLFLYLLPHGLHRLGSLFEGAWKNFLVSMLVSVSRLVLRTVFPQNPVPLYNSDISPVVVFSLTLQTIC